MRKILFIIIILIIVVLVGAYVTRNTLVKSAIEEGSDYALGVESSVGSVSLDIKGSSCGIDQYAVKNPDGFKSPNLFSISKGYFDLDAGSVFDKEIIIDSIIFDSITVSIEQQDAKSNFKAILDHINSLDLSKSENSEKKIKIGKIAFNAITVDVAATLLGNDYTKQMTVSDFTLTNVGGKDGTTVSGVVSRITKELLSRTKDAGLNGLPAEYKEKLNELKDNTTEELKEKVNDKVKSLLGG